MENLLKSKVTFCPGPGAVLKDWYLFQEEFFGRGDKRYKSIKFKTLQWIKKKSGQDIIIPVAGAGSTAAIVAFNSFLSGNILIINTGYYSKRWSTYIKNNINFKSYKVVNYDDFINEKLKKKKYNWVVFVYVETAHCVKFDLERVKKISKKFKSKLILDATASIGLEKKHELADVIFFSSCKGLLGPTGLGFIAYKNKVKFKNISDFWNNIKTHANSKYTLGYNCIASLYGVSKKHSEYINKIKYAKSIMKNYIYQKNPIPLIGIPLKYKLKKKISNTILYEPRDNPGYDLIFFLGIVKFNKKEIEKILKNRIIKNLNYRIGPRK